MSKKYILLTICFFVLVSCGYKIQKDSFGEPILNEKVKYTFNEIPNSENLQKIDTTAYYVQVFEGREYNENEMANPRIIIFHNDSFFERESLLYFGKFKSHRNKNSVYYGGKYRIKNDVIELEEFFPSSGTKTNYYNRNISKGKLNGNKITFDDGNSLIEVFEKKQKLN